MDEKTAMLPHPAVANCRCKAKRTAGFAKRFIAVIILLIVLHHIERMVIAGVFHTMIS